MAKRKFRWTKSKTQAAIDIANGYTLHQVAERVGISRKTLYSWRQKPEFQAEVDRLSLMCGIAAKAERLRIAKRAVRQLVTDAGVKTNADLLTWLRYAQSETDGIKIDIASFLDETLAMAGIGQVGDSTENTDTESGEPTKA